MIYSASVPQRSSKCQSCFAGLLWEYNEGNYISFIKQYMAYILLSDSEDMNLGTTQGKKHSIIGDVMSDIIWKNINGLFF